MLCMFFHFLNVCMKKSNQINTKQDKTRRVAIIIAESTWYFVLTNNNRGWWRITLYGVDIVYIIICVLCMVLLYFSSCIDCRKVIVRYSIRWRINRCGSCYLVLCRNVELSWVALLTTTLLYCTVLCGTTSILLIHHQF